MWFASDGGILFPGVVCIRVFRNHVREYLHVVSGVPFIDDIGFREGKNCLEGTFRYDSAVMLDDIIGKAIIVIVTRSHIIDFRAVGRGSVFGFTAWGQECGDFEGAFRFIRDWQGDDTAEFRLCVTMWVSPAVQ